MDAERPRKRHTAERCDEINTPQEAKSVLALLKGEIRLMAGLLYGSGLRRMECLRLRVKDLDFAYTRFAIRLRHIY